MYGYSPIIELFLKAAARKRRFQVVIAEGYPSLDGHKLAASLPKAHNGNVTPHNTHYQTHTINIVYYIISYHCRLKPN